MGMGASWSTVGVLEEEETSDEPGGEVERRWHASVTPVEDDDDVEE